jgi:hypothetical protein
MLNAKGQIVDGFKSPKVLFKVANANIVLHADSRLQPIFDRQSLTFVARGASRGRPTGLLTSFMKLL